MVKRFIPRLRNDQRKSSILQTALKLIATKGFESVTMQMIAKEEGISDVILYRHFRNIYKILEEILDVFVPMVTKSFKELLDTVKIMVTNLAESLPLITKLYINRIQEFPYFMMFMTKEADKIPQYLQEGDKKSKTKIDFGVYRKILYKDLKLEKVLTDYFQRCKKEGNLRQDLEPEDCTRTILSIFLPLIIRSSLFPTAPPTNEKDFEAIIKRQTKIVLYAFLPPEQQVNI
jgi:AcrR family transcriptional regulator